MLKKERQSKQFYKIASAAYSHLDKFFKNEKPEELHQYRVAIKKLKSLLTFKKAFQKSDEKSCLSDQSMRVFHLAGEIRQLDINLKLLKKFNFIEPVVLASQHKLRARQMLKLINVYKKYKKKIILSNTKIANDFGDMDNNFIVLRFKKQFKKIENSYIHKLNKPVKLHMARKRIKQLLYMYRILPESINTNLKINLNYLETLQHYIGEWHDLFIAEKFLKERLNNKNESLIKLKNAEKVRKELLKNQLRDFKTKFWLN